MSDFDNAPAARRHQVAASGFSKNNLARLSAPSPDPYTVLEPGTGTTVCHVGDRRRDFDRRVHNIGRLVLSSLKQNDSDERPHDPESATIAVAIGQEDEGYSTFEIPGVRDGSDLCRGVASHACSVRVRVRRACGFRSDAGHGTGGIRQSAIG